jgi:hypothetical protein
MSFVSQPGAGDILLQFLVAPFPLARLNHRKRDPGAVVFECDSVSWLTQVVLSRVRNSLGDRLPAPSAVVSRSKHPSTSNRARIMGRCVRVQQIPS